MYYIDNKDSTDPWLNLAMEEFAVRSLDKSRDYLILYANQPSLIIGKHQNVIEEVNLATAGELGIPIIRRISGGGAVYHDTGNLNISFITNQTLKNFNKYSNFLKPVLEILNKLSLPVVLNERNNIVLNNKKISGNAQFTSRHRMLSHGTLLIDSDLGIMNQLIKPENRTNYHSKSTKSIRSNVTNINNHLDNPVDAVTFKQLLLDKIFKSDIKYAKISIEDWLEIEKIAETKYKSWQWNYGLSPECIIKKVFVSKVGEVELEMVVDKGIIQSIILKNPALNNEQKRRINKYFINQPLDYESLKGIVSKIKMDYSFSYLSELPWDEIILN